MVGLSIVLEDQKGPPQAIINKVTMVKPSPSPPHPSPPFLPSYRWNTSSDRMAASFLKQCFFCKQKLLPGNDIYMYKGDKAFCSMECRCKQIFMDEEEAVKREKFRP